MSGAEFYQDPFQKLAQPQPFFSRLQHLYRVLREQYSGIERFSLALYDADSDHLTTFSAFGEGVSPLSGYSNSLAATPSLRKLAEDGHLRVVNDMRTFRSDDLSTHTEALLAQGFRSGFSMPLVSDGRFLGVLFLNSRSLNYFSESMASYCALWGHLVQQELVREKETILRLQALASWALDVGGLYSAESDEHMRRMSAYVRLIARGVRQKHRLADTWIEYLALFAPLHDIGKLAVPSALLHKHGELSEDEFEQMKQHVLTGRALVDRAISQFALDNLEHIDMLRNLVQFHHEKLDGSGYLGLSGTAAIPLEARIVAVADITDALLNHRSYKTAWQLPAVLDELKQLAGQQLDADCVAVILNNPEDVLAINERWPSRAPEAAATGKRRGSAVE